MEKYIAADTVRNILSYEDLIPLMEKALCKVSDLCVVQPVRFVLPVEKENGFLGLMPALCENQDVLATKLVTFFPNNTRKYGVPTHNAVIIVFSTKTGIPKAIMDGEVITTMRTAAVSTVATKDQSKNENKRGMMALDCSPEAYCMDEMYLGPAYPHKLAILGAGVQARSHFKALSSLFHFKEVYIWSRTFESAEKCAKEVQATACNTAEEAVKDADVIVTVTAAVNPVLKADWVKPGAHINGNFKLEWHIVRPESPEPGKGQSVGACRSDWAEIDPELMRSCVLYVDSREGALTESGDVILSKAEIYGELGEVISGRKLAVRDKITVFKSLGMAIEDSMSAKLVLDLLNSNKS